ncbi:MAG: hypothetical protein ACK4IS_10620 [Erythrobacter sp.]
MRLFAPDLYRNFAIGFAAGALLIAGVSAGQWGDEVSAPARAAEVPHTPGPDAATFITAPEPVVR